MSTCDTGIESGLRIGHGGVLGGCASHDDQWCEIMTVM